MSDTMRLRYTPLPITAGATVQIKTQAIGGFLCVTTGTLTIVRNNDDGTTTTLVTAFPVTAGQWVHIPFFLGRNGGTVTSATAVGVLGVA